MAWVMKRRKALASGLVTGVVAYLGVASDGVTAPEWAAVVLAVAGSFGLVHQVSNAGA